MRNGAVLRSGTSVKTGVCHCEHRPFPRNSFHARTVSAAYITVGLPPMDTPNASVSESGAQLAHTRIGALT